MSTLNQSAIARLEGLLARVQRNRQKPRTSSDSVVTSHHIHHTQTSPALAREGLSQRSSLPPPLEIRVDEVVVRPSDRAPSMLDRAPLISEPAPATLERVPANSERAPAISEPAPATIPSAAAPLPSAPPAQASAQTFAAEPIRPLSILPPSSPIAKVVTEPREAVPATFGSLIRNALSLRARK